MKRISVDMDGVIADVYSQFIKMYKEESGRLLSLKDAYGRPEHVVFENAYQYIARPGFFRNAPVLKDSREVLQKLAGQYEVFIVSAAMEFPKSLEEKQSWLQEHFPFIHWKQMVFCGSKQIIKADIMIDDHFKNLDPFEGETILFTQPHNILAENGRHRRVNSWREIEKMLLG